MKWEVHPYGMTERFYVESDDQEYLVDVDSKNLSLSWDDETGYRSVDVPVEAITELLCRNGIMELMIDYYVVYQVMNS